MASLDIAGVRKSFGAVEVLKHIDISIADGEFLVLVGPSGCGKSTLLSLIAGLDAVTAGTININGQSVNALHPKDRDIAMVFQSYALYPNMTVAQNMAFGLEMRKIPRGERDRLVDEVADLLQIRQLLKRKPGQLSGGQRQRVAMGRALVRQPQIFLFDEPLSNLDAKLRVEMRTEIKKLHQKLGATIVYVTHDQIEAMTLASRIAIMNGGELQQLGTPRELYDTPANTFVATFIGSPAMNIIEARLEGNSLKLAQSVSISKPEALNGLPDGELLVGLRPENIVEGSSVEIDVSVTEPTGPDTLAVLIIGEREVTARLNADTAVKPGSKARFDFEMSKASFFDKTSGNRLLTT